MIKKIIETRINTIGIVNNKRVMINLRKDADIDNSNFSKQLEARFPSPPIIYFFFYYLILMNDQMNQIIFPSKNS